MALLHCTALISRCEVPAVNERSLVN